MTFTALHTVAVPVADQEAATAWYTDVLGMELRMDAELQEGFRWIEFGVRLLSSDAAAHHAALSAAGAAVGELLRWDGVPPMFAMRDLDANTLYVMEGDA